MVVVCCFMSYHPYELSSSTLRLIRRDHHHTTPVHLHHHHHHISYIIPAILYNTHTSSSHYLRSTSKKARPIINYSIYINCYSSSCLPSLHCKTPHYLNASYPGLQRLRVVYSGIMAKWGLSPTNDIRTIYRHSGHADIACW